MTPCSRVVVERENWNSTHLPKKSGLPTADFERERQRLSLSNLLAWVSKTLTVFTTSGGGLNFRRSAEHRQELPKWQFVCSLLRVGLACTQWNAEACCSPQPSHSAEGQRVFSA
jgi:hypothetical protein